MGSLRTRRELLRDGAAASAAAAAWSLGLRLLPAEGQQPGRRVAILGGGVAGLTAAHELIERGFDVTAYERKALGGKARSIPVPGSGTDGRPDLPGEHGFRFFPGFYHNLGDTMRRIPFPGNPGGTHQNLVRASTYLSSRAGGRPDLTLPLSLPPVGTVEALYSSLVSIFDTGAHFGIGAPIEVTSFVLKLLVYLTSCDERRLGQWEYVTWTDFTRADEMSDEYRRFFTEGLTRNLAAMKSEEASTHSIGYIGEATVLSILGQGNEPGGTADRVLNGSTSSAWLDPWIAHLIDLGVLFNVGWTAESLQLADGRIASAGLRDPAGQQQTIDADWFVVAMPVERAAGLLSPDLLAADPRLEGITRLRTDWMNGLMFYLRQEVPITHGHVNYLDSPWAVTSISQAQFWNRDFRDHGDGTVAECLSTIISDWATPGILYGKAARDCTPPEIAAEVWAQMKGRLNDSYGNALRDDMLHSWFLDPAIIGSGTPGVTNDEPLFIQNAGSWVDRPDSATAIPNLFLAGDWVRTNINVTTMEGANEGGRQAVNALLDAAGSDAPRCTLQGLYRPEYLDALKAIDRDRYRQGLPNLLDIDALGVEVAQREVTDLVTSLLPGVITVTG